MLKSQRVKFIMDHLESTYPKTPIPLNNNNNFELLVAVLLSAQCTDERVNRVTPILFAIANNPFEMEKVDLKVIYDIIRPCGLAPKKSKAIQDLSKILVDKFDGIVPKDINELEKLPGVGHKTASVVMSQGFGHPAFPVDTHIHRLAKRWGLSKGKSVVQTENDLKKLFPQDTWNRRHLQIIYFGREHCPALRHNLSNCLICSWAATKKQIILESRK